MIPSLEELDSIIADQVHDSVLLGQTARPDVAAEVAKPFWFADAGEWVAQDRLYEIDAPQRELSVSGDPMAQVVDELGLEDCQEGSQPDLAESRFTRARNSFTVCGSSLPLRARPRAVKRRWAFAGERKR